MRCVFCSEEIKDDAVFCPWCGGTQSAFTPENTKKNKGKKVAFILIAVLMLILAAGAVVLLDGFDIISTPDFFTFLDDDRNDKNPHADKNKEVETHSGQSEETTLSEKTTAPEETIAPEETTLPAARPLTDYEDIKLGIILLHDGNSSYDLNFMLAVDRMKDDIGLSDDQILYRMNTPESSDCYDTAVELAEMGCNIIFANSFGHEDFIIKAAKEYPEVEFFHASGVRAHTEGLSNFHNVYASVYEGRYLTGVAAGMKLNEMIEKGEITEAEAKLGYVGAFTYAEVISGYTAFYLGAKSVCPTATMDVKFTGSWYDEQREKETARELIENGCVIISQHADSMGAPSACEEAKVPNISYNGSTVSACPESFLMSSSIDWTPCFTYIVKAFASGDDIPFDWVGTLKDSSVEISSVNPSVAAEGTQEKLEETIDAIIDGRIEVFDTANFTIGGNELDFYIADVDFDSTFTPDTEVIYDGVFMESEFRSAPYFDLRIDGINLIDEVY